MTAVAVVGTGLLGQGIALVVARSGTSVMLHDASPAILERAATAVRATAPPGVAVEVAPTLEAAVAGAEFVIEAVIEDLRVKRELFMRMGMANERAILMSNSSALPIGQISRDTSSPERAVGTHWWNPPELIPVVEVIRGRHTSVEAIGRAATFLSKLGKRPVRVAADVPGFIGNRLQHALWREAIGLLAQRSADGPTIDRLVAQSLGASLIECGPIAEMQRLGLERVRGLWTQLAARLVNERTPSPLLRAKVQAGELGAKSGQGFLTWLTGARERAAIRLSEQVSARLRGEGQEVPRRKPMWSGAERDIADRLRLAVWREAVSLVDNRVCTPADVDLMACNTFGLRLGAMGPIENADYVGLDLTLAIHEIILPSLQSDITPPASLPLLEPSTVRPL